MTETVAQAQDLIGLAQAKNKKLLVDQTLIYTGAVRKIKELIDKGELGELVYYDSTRVNLGLFQQDVNVLWDLAPPTSRSWTTSCRSRSSRFPPPDRATTATASCPSRC